MTISPKFKPNFLQWPVDRVDQTWRAYIVEPKEYEPSIHGEIFSAALNYLTVPAYEQIEPTFSISSGDKSMERNARGNETTVGAPKHFDLITFPEAFLPKEDLLSTLKMISMLNEIGCVHVGLRPSKSPDRHLFRANELCDIVKEIVETVPDIVIEDFTQFCNWLKLQNNEDNFNVACLFTLDSAQKVRVCLHPKLVCSKFEVHPEYDRNMKEADLLTLVELIPQDKSLLSVTIQPLICADVLFIAAARPYNNPLCAANYNADCFDSPPDHIDIVSVVTRTPQVPISSADGVRRQWQQEFRTSFSRAAKELVRHYTSIFILSNFRNFSRSVTGGLSGVFLPIQVCPETYKSYIQFTAFGRKNRSKNKDNVWLFPTKDISKYDKNISSLGYIASLDPDNESRSIAYLFGFTIPRLPRHFTRWPATQKLRPTKIELKPAILNDLGAVTFINEDV